VSLRDARGFTLVELLVVIVLLALIATLAASAPPPGRLPGEVTAAARQLAAALRQARSDAMAQNREVTVAIDVAARRYRVDAREAVLPPQVTLTVDAAQTEQADATTGGISFFADGSSTGGRITLAHGRAEETITVHWLTGRVALDER
jgi:general secretion pathway protein H